MSKAELLQQIRESERQNAASLEQAESDRQASLRKAQQARAGLVEATLCRCGLAHDASGVSEEKALEALRECNGEPAEAIIQLMED